MIAQDSQVYEETILKKKKDEKVWYQSVFEKVEKLSLAANACWKDLYIYIFRCKGKYKEESRIQIAASSKGGQSAM